VKFSKHLKHFLYKKQSVAGCKDCFWGRRRNSQNFTNARQNNGKWPSAWKTVTQARSADFAAK